jgi:hypothetical protein
MFLHFVDFPLGPPPFALRAESFNPLDPAPYVPTTVKNSCPAYAGIFLLKRQNKGRILSSSLGGFVGMTAHPLETKVSINRLIEVPFPEASHPSERIMTGIFKSLAFRCNSAPARH